MGPDADTPSNREARRKTLDDIRREIDAEFCPPEVSEPPASFFGRQRARESDEADLEADLDEIDLDELIVDRDRGADWRGYMMAGVVGCIVGQLLILGYVVVTRYGGDFGALRAALSIPQVSALLRRTEQAGVSASVRRDRTASPADSESAEPPSSAATASGALASREAPPAREEGGAFETPVAAPTPAPAETEAAPPSIASAPTLPPAPSRSDTLAALPPAPPMPPTPAPALPRSEARVSPPAALPERAASEARRAPAGVTERPAMPRVTRQAPMATVSAPAAAAAPPGPQDWVQSQAQVRKALGEWLTLWQRGGDASMADAEVILGADGRTAKTRIPMRSGNRIIYREQRWERSRQGWNIVAEREVPPTSP